MLSRIIITIFDIIINLLYITITLLLPNYEIGIFALLYVNSTGRLGCESHYYEALNTIISG
jgi:hypothetical protein